mmetsp:Transcript_23796/g.59742  ORF Transcript_23796/g.59742 Transcript_23796/m.59742 type:complete len:138 (+) Transcript_23796:715-1128(+)
MHNSQGRWTSYASGHFGYVSGTPATDEVFRGLPQEGWATNEGAFVPEKMRYWTADMATACPSQLPRYCSWTTADRTYSVGEILKKKVNDIDIRARTVLWEAPSLRKPPSQAQGAFGSRERKGSGHGLASGTRAITRC